MIKNNTSLNKSINDSTKDFFSKIWYRNYLKNLKLISKKEKSGFIFENSFQFQNKSILFIGASPILEEEIELIKIYQNSFYLFSSDTSSNTLIQNGIKPDLVISIDSSRGTIYHFQNLPKEIPILTWLGGNSEIFYLDNPIFIFLSNYPLDQILSNVLFKNQNLILDNPTLNVSGISKSIAIKFLASQLVLSGISFQKYKGKTHAKGTGYENYSLSFINRKFPLENYNPITYKKEISKKNELALFHLLDKEKISVEFLKNINEFEKISKNKFLSIRITEPEEKQFLKFIKLNQIEIQNSLSLTKKNFQRFLID